MAACNGGSNITFTDNAVTNTIADEGVFFGGINGGTISNNVFENNFQNGIPFSQCHNCNVTGNYAVDTGWDIEDAGPQTAGTNSGTWSGNTFACINGTSYSKAEADEAIIAATVRLCVASGVTGAREPVAAMRPGNHATKANTAASRSKTTSSPGQVPA